MFGVLSGKKTYVVCITGILSIIAGILTGDITYGEAIPGIITAFSGMTIRGAIANK